jgi:hypothetical protein
MITFGIHTSQARQAETVLRAAGVPISSMTPQGKSAVDFTVNWSADRGQEINAILDRGLNLGVAQANRYRRNPASDPVQWLIVLVGIAGAGFATFAGLVALTTALVIVAGIGVVLMLRMAGEARQMRRIAALTPQGHKWRNLPIVGAVVLLSLFGIVVYAFAVFGAYL